MQDFSHLSTAAVSVAGTDSPGVQSSVDAGPPVDACASPGAQTVPPGTPAPVTQKHS